MDIHPIHTEADYRATLKEISALMDSDPEAGTPEGDRLDILSTLVVAYEASFPWECRIRSRPSSFGWSKAACLSRIWSQSSASVTGFTRS